MTSFDRIERRMPELMADMASAGVPDYFDSMLTQAAATRQRPAWASLERWLPMGVNARIDSLRSPSLRPMLILAVLGLLMIAALAVAAIASRPEETVPVPAPFGPAANGAMFYHDANGVISSADPTTGTSTEILRGSGAYEYPLPSRDGQRIAFEQTQLGVTQLFVADVDGSNMQVLDGQYAGLFEKDWSGDGRQLAILSMVDAVPTLSILEADGSGSRTVDIDREVSTFWYQPDGGFVVKASEQPGGTCRPDVPSLCGLFVIDATGQEVRQILPEADFAGLSIDPAPDGRSVLYVRWTDAEPGRLHIVDTATGEDRAVAVSNMDPAGQENVNNAWFSPDGTKILFDRFEVDGEHWAVVPAAGGEAINIGPKWPLAGDGGATEAAWSPDGRSILARYRGADGSDAFWLLDPTGAGDDRQLTLPASQLPTWQRLAP
ncbi:MAG TPA: hypothetical protein VIF84_08465 [Candidatus Limnocylindrales bacterium]